jgi:hypothetical protein
MTKYEQLRQHLIGAVMSDDVTEKTLALEENAIPGYFDGLNEIEIMNLKTIRSDIWRTRAELYIAQAQSENVAA